jgi:hypothetical protein
MKLSRAAQIWVLFMSLNSPGVWGETVDVTTACRETISERLHTSGRLSFLNSDRLAAALCEDDRILGPFTEIRFHPTAPVVEDVPSPRHPFSPLAIGLIGASRNEARAAAAAVQELIFPISNSIFSWNGDRGLLREWREEFRGGKFGGVLQVDIDDATETQLDNGVRGAIEAMTFATAYRMDSYVLILNSPHDVRTRFRSLRSPIRWVQFDSTDCERRLRL